MGSGFNDMEEGSKREKEVDSRDRKWFLRVGRGFNEPQKGETLQEAKVITFLLQLKQSKQ